jgi:hypothetical protein
LSVNPFGTKEGRLAREILRYLTEHPDAKDTLEGIAQWWLLREQQIAHVEMAVALLVSRNLLRAHQRGVQPAYYELNRGEEQEIARLLNAKEPGD